MITVNAILETNSSNIEKIKSSIEEMEQETLNEKGCQDYVFSVELNNPNVLRITERWDSMKDLEDHFQTPHMLKFQAALEENPVDKTTAFFYESKEVVPGGLDMDAFN